MVVKGIAHKVIFGFFNGPMTNILCGTIKLHNKVVDRNLGETRWLESCPECCPHVSGLKAKKADHTHRRIQETVTQGANVRTVYFVHPNNVGGLSYEREETKVGATVTRDESRHYISVGGAVVAVVKTLNGAGVVSSDNNLTQYWHKDALGSVVAVSNAAGVVQERMAFDAWGRRVRSTGLADAAVNPAHGDRGYTGHEHLDEQGLIHMNGRIAHPLLGRFLSSDPHVQDPNDLQNFNRYSYVLNNPLKYTDPSGEFWWYVAYAAGAALARNGNEYWQIVGVVLMAYSGVAAADGGAFGVAGATQTQSQTLATVAFGAVGGAASPGATSQDVVLGAIMAGALNVVGGTLTGESMMGQRILAHAFLGCMQGMVSGGQCGPSAIAMAAGKAVTEGLEGSGLGKYQGAAIAAVAGGAGAVIGGGKFANGAVQAGFGYLFNELGSCYQRGYCTNDRVSDGRIMSLDKSIQSDVTGFVNQVGAELGVDLRVSQGTRTIQQQNELYAQGRTQSALNAVGLSNVQAQPQLPRVTDAYGIQSNHVSGKAFDVVRMTSNGGVNWTPIDPSIAAIGARYGFTWGGTFRKPDYPHFQK